MLIGQASVREDGDLGETHSSLTAAGPRGWAAVFHAFTSFELTCNVAAIICKQDFGFHIKP